MEFWQPQQAAWRTPDDRPGAHSYRSASFSAECGETSSPPSAQDQERSYYGRQVNTNDGTDIESSSFSTQDDNTSYDSLLNEYYTPGPIFDIEQGSCPLPELSGLSPWWPEYKYGHDGSVNWTEFIETGFG
jgi:hypothetical protein